MVTLPSSSGSGGGEGGASMVGTPTPLLCIPDSSERGGVVLAFHIDAGTPWHHHSFPLCIPSSMLRELARSASMIKSDQHNCLLSITAFFSHLFLTPFPCPLFCSPSTDRAVVKFGTGPALRPVLFYHALCTDNKKGNQSQRQSTCC